MHTAIRNSTFIHIITTQETKHSTCQMYTSVPTLPCMVPSGLHPNTRPFLHPAGMAAAHQQCLSQWLCFHSQDTLAAWGCSAFSVPHVKIGRNSSQKCLPPCWFSSALPLCSEDTSRAQGKGTGKPRGSLTKICLQQNRPVGGDKDMDHHAGMLQAPGTC